MATAELLSPQEVDLLLQGEPAAKIDRRRQARRPCHVPLRIAAYDGEHLPQADLYHEAQCHDISEGGFSFCWRTRPQFRNLILELTMRGNRVLISARVVHCTRVSEGQWFIGCRFTGRVPERI